MDEIISKQVIIVAGMHRSGTSAWARAVGLLGADLGPDLQPGNPFNPKGFWEDRAIRAVDDEILTAMGRTWDWLSPVPDEALESRQLDQLKMRAVELIRRRLEATDCFAFKDPRATLLLPFWKQVLDHIGVRISHVIVTRNPISVARSLGRRNGFDDIKSHYLWLLHTASALRNSQEGARIVCSYDYLLDDPMRELSRVAVALGLKFDADDEETKRFSSDFLDDSLRHSRYQAGDLDLDPSVPECMLPLNTAMERLAGDLVDFDSAEVTSALTQAEEHLYGSSKALELAAKSSDAQQAIGELEALIEDLERRLSREKFLVADLEAALDERVESLSAELEEERAGSRELSRLLREKEREAARARSLAAHLREVIAETGAYGGVDQKTPAELADRVQVAEDRLREILDSRSWKLTKPLRFSGRLARGEWGQVRDGIREAIKSRRERGTPRRDGG